MKGFIIFALLAVAALPSGTVALARQVTSPPAVVGTSGTDDTGGTMAEAKLAQIIAQAGAIGILAVVLFFYRRDFLRKAERTAEEYQRALDEKNRELGQRKTEREELLGVLRESTEAITASAVATARQTDATHRLARTVESLEKRQS